MDYSCEIFDWERYVLKYNDLQIDMIMREKDAWNHWMNNGQKEKRDFFVKDNDFLPIQNVNDNMIYFMNIYIDDYFDLNQNQEEKKPDFDWVLYLCSNPELFINGIQNEKDALNHWKNTGQKENRPFNVENYNRMLRYEFLIFDWVRYTKINKDLKHLKNEKCVWNHWLYHGIKEERPTYLINNSKIHNGRFGNLFFINMAIHFLSMKYDLKFNYKYYNKFKRLGIDLFIGTNTYQESFVLDDGNFYDLICQKDYKKTNLMITNNMWCQTKEFTYALKYYFSKAKTKINIIKNNIFRERYSKNNDLYIHLRLGDVKSRIKNVYQYYEKAISQIQFDNGFISSDDLNSPICLFLIHKYNLKILNYDEIETIMFASTCKHIILSGGTFSWLIGFFAFFSENIYYPNIDNKWYGDIFIFPEWKMI